MSYSGDRSGSYDHGRGTGLVGKVMGPDATGAYRVVSSAAYNPVTDRTLAETTVIAHPSRVLDGIEAGE